MAKKVSKKSTKAKNAKSAKNTKLVRSVPKKNMKAVRAKVVHAKPVKTSLPARRTTTKPATRKRAGVGGLLLNLLRNVLRLFVGIVRVIVDVIKALFTKVPKKYLLIGLSVVAIIVAGTTVGARIFHRDVPDEPEISVEEPKEEEPEVTTPLETPEDLPGEEKMAAENYHVAANRPRVISIPSVGIYGRIIEVGKVNGAMDAPKDVRLVGWYNGAALPGQNGAVVMDGHGGPLGTGIFKSLVNVKNGDKIIIEMGDEKTRYTYVVRETVELKDGTPANNYMRNTVFKKLDGKSTLTLITCTGAWIQATQTYTNRFFVRATML